MSTVFISYRRADSADITGRVFDRLVARYGHDRVFKDVDSIPYGSDFREAVDRAIGRCRVLLVVIGPQWVTLADRDGGRRLDKENDLVRVEVETALARGVAVV